MQNHHMLLQKLTQRHHLFSNSNDDEESPWLITFSDVISLLLVVILAWTSYQLGSRTKKEAAQPQNPAINVQPLEAGHGFMEPVATYSQHAIFVEEGSVVVVLKDSQDFDSQTHGLTEAGRHTVRQLAAHSRKDGKPPVSFEIIPVSSPVSDNLANKKDTSSAVSANSVIAELNGHGVERRHIKAIF